MLTICRTILHSHRKKEIANYCDKIGANVDDVRKGIGTDTRIGKRFLYAGIGYGGSCFPKDIKALCYAAKEHQHEFNILKATIKVNDNQPLILIDKIKSHFKSLKGKSFAVWGLSFKPDTDDVREAPSIYLIEKLLKEGVKISAFDPEATINAKKTLKDKITYSSSMYEAIKGKDALIIATEWPGFVNPEFKKIAQLLENKVIFDGRNIPPIQIRVEVGCQFVKHPLQFGH